MVLAQLAGSLRKIYKVKAQFEIYHIIASLHSKMQHSAAGSLTALRIQSP